MIGGEEEEEEIIMMTMEGDDMFPSGCWHPRLVPRHYLALSILMSMHVYACLCTCLSHVHAHIYAHVGACVMPHSHAHACTLLHFFFYTRSGFQQYIDPASFTSYVQQYVGAAFLSIGLKVGLHV